MREVLSPALEVLSPALEVLSPALEVLSPPVAGLPPPAVKEEDMSGTQWLPTREQDLTDLCRAWQEILDDAEKITAYGWDAPECAAALGIITGFVDKRTAYERVNSTANRLAKDECPKACGFWAWEFAA